LHGAVSYSQYYSASKVLDAVTGKHNHLYILTTDLQYDSNFRKFTQLYLMELYFGGIHLIVKKYLKFRKE
jgi:hypothetical protein